MVRVKKVLAPMILPKYTKYNMNRGMGLILRPQFKKGVGQMTEYIYLCPNCGQSFKSDKGFNQVKTCKKCNHKFVSTVCFEE